MPSSNGWGDFNRFWFQIHPPVGQSITHLFYFCSFPFFFLKLRYHFKVLSNQILIHKRSHKKRNNVATTWLLRDIKHRSISEPRILSFVSMSLSISNHKQARNLSWISDHKQAFVSQLLISFSMSNHNKQQQSSDEQQEEWLHPGTAAHLEERHHLEDFEN